MIETAHPTNYKKMKVKLYKNFKHWYHGGVIWIFSDPHFNDSDCKLMDANWPTPEEQVRLINSKVGKKDTLIILGDIGSTEWIKKIKGYKVLVMGNHDKGASNYVRVVKRDYLPISKIGIKTTDKKELNKWVKNNIPNIDRLISYPVTEEVFDKDDYSLEYDYDNHLFDEIYEGPIFISDKILLSHEPIELAFGINIHGHVHNSQDNNISKDKFSFNVCSNIIGYKPIRLDEIVIGPKYIDIHESVINRRKV